MFENELYEMADTDRSVNRNTGVGVANVDRTRRGNPQWYDVRPFLSVRATATSSGKRTSFQILRGRRSLMLWHVLRNVLHCSPHPWAIADFFMRENPRNINVYPLMKGQR